MTPKHYKTEKGFDVIDICKAYDLNFNRGNVVKYVCRAGKKDDEIKDLEKSINFLQREVEFLKKEKEENKKILSDWYANADAGFFGNFNRIYDEKTNFDLLGRVEKKIPASVGDKNISLSSNLFMRIFQGNDITYSHGGYNYTCDWDLAAQSLSYVNNKGNRKYVFITDE